MDNLNGTSWIDFGEIRADSVDDVDDIVYLDLEDHFFWLQLVTGVGFGSLDEDDIYGFEVEYSAIFDSGASFTYVP